MASKVKAGQVVVDLVRILPRRGEAYDGICW
jgi:hypothetical protein